MVSATLLILTAGVEKDANGISTLYSLADFADEDGTRIRKDESYEKNYLIGNLLFERKKYKDLEEVR